MGQMSGAGPVSKQPGPQTGSGTSGQNQYVGPCYPTHGDPMSRITWRCMCSNRGMMEALIAIGLSEPWQFTLPPLPYLYTHGEPHGLDNSALWARCSPCTIPGASLALAATLRNSVCVKIVHPCQFWQ